MLRSCFGVLGALNSGRVEASENRALGPVEIWDSTRGLFVIHVWTAPDGQEVSTAVR